MRSFKLEDRTYSHLEEVQRQVLAETIEGCLYTMFLNQPHPSSKTIQDVLSWYQNRVSLFAESLETIGESSEEKQIAYHLKNLADYLKVTMQEPRQEIQRKDLTEKIVKEIATVARGLKRKKGTPKDSYDEQFLLDYSSRLLARDTTSSTK